MPVSEVSAINRHPVVSSQKDLLEKQILADETRKKNESQIEDTAQALRTAERLVQISTIGTRVNILV